MLSYGINVIVGLASSLLSSYFDRRSHFSISSGLTLKQMSGRNSNNDITTTLTTTTNKKSGNNADNDYARLLLEQRPNVLPFSGQQFNRGEVCEGRWKMFLAVMDKMVPNYESLFGKSNKKEAVKHRDELKL